MRVITANVNGIRSAAKRGFFTWLAEQEADIICLQEIKSQAEQRVPTDLYYPPGYHVVYSDAIKKGYSGVALFARKAPVNVVSDIGILPDEGRYLQFDYPGLSVISVYFPSGTMGDVRQQVKYAFLDAILPYWQNLIGQGQSLMIAGDINIAHHPIDLKNWKANQRSTGFLPEERAWLDTLFQRLDLVDVFRTLHPDTPGYTWWTYRAGAFDRDVGWRIDYQWVTNDLQGTIRDARVARDEGRWSDHAPLIVDYTWEWPS